MAVKSLVNYGEQLARLFKEVSKRRTHAAMLLKWAREEKKSREVICIWESAYSEANSIYELVRKAMRGDF